MLSGRTNDAGAEVKDAEQRLRQPGLDLGLRPAEGAKAARAARRGTKLRAEGAALGTGSPGCLLCRGKELDPQTTFPAPPDETGGEESSQLASGSPECRGLCSPWPCAFGRPVPGKF